MAKNIIINNEILEKLQNSTEEIHKRLDMQYELIENILNREKISEPSTVTDFYGQDEREKKLANAIKDTIDILEQTKKSFKSKRLEILRKRLTDVLIES